MTKYDTVIVIYIHKKLRKVTENIIVLEIKWGESKNIILYCFGLCFCGIHHVQYQRYQRRPPEGAASSIPFVTFHQLTPIRTRTRPRQPQLRLCPSC